MADNENILQRLGKLFQNQIVLRKIIQLLQYFLAREQLKKVYFTKV